MPDPLSNGTTTVLEPALTQWDKRVLRALNPWPDNWLDGGLPRPDLPFLNAWQVAEKLRCDNVAEVRSTLRGLCNFHYAWSKGWDHRQVWLRERRGTEAIS